MSKPKLLVILNVVTAAEKAEKSEKEGTGEKVMEEIEKTDEVAVASESAEKKEKAEGEVQDVKNGECRRVLSLIISIVSLPVIKLSFILLSFMCSLLWLQMRARWKRMLGKKSKGRRRRRPRGTANQLSVRGSCLTLQMEDSQVETSLLHKFIIH